MGAVCYCNFSSLKRQEITLDINKLPIETKISNFTKLKLYFQSNENNKISTQRSKKETQYDLIIRRLLEEDQPKKKHPRRKITIRNQKKILDIVNQIIQEYEDNLSLVEQKIEK